MASAVNPVVAGESLAAGLQVAFLQTYEPKYKTVQERLTNVMQLGLPSDKNLEKYFYWNSVPHPELWPRGQSISTTPFDGVQFQTENFDWGKKITWHENDRQDDQTQSLEGHARNLAGNFALLNERIFFQILLGTADPKLLPAIPIAPDGATFFSTTAGGAPRFGATDGNLVSGTGVVSGSDINNDFFDGAVSQFKQFQDTEGEPLWDEETLDDGYTIIYGAKNDKVFRQAFEQARTVSILQNVAQTENVAAAAVTNLIMASGLQITLWSTQRIADDDWYVFLNASKTKSVFRQDRSPLRENVQTMANSDVARDTKVEGAQWDQRMGFGLSLPIMALKIDN